LPLIFCYFLLNTITVHLSLFMAFGTDADEPARSRLGTLDLRFVYEIDPDLIALVRASTFSEDRENGTKKQRNHTEIRSYAASIRWQNPELGTLFGNVYGGTQTFMSTFSAISIDRRLESLTRDQAVPTHTVGLSAQWSRSVGSRHNLLLGLDWRDQVGVFL
jgi:hypothetical protein